MRAYWAAVLSTLSTAIYDVLFVALLSASPMLLGRLSILVLPGHESESYWAFLSNGQLAFFAMSPLAALLLICFRGTVPVGARLWLGPFSLLCMLLLITLVGLDPTLQRGMAFFGVAASWLYLIVLALRILAEAMKSVGPAEALQAGADAATVVQSQLEARMKGRAE